ncbi:MAG: SprB repeat-containing protein [Bacteroidetes bacterium]|nr:SprB repeat-containing protein [Bacteroidota bacterium]
MNGTPTDVTTNGGSDGSIDVTATGGTPNYTYLWNNGSTDEDQSNLPAGTYAVTVRMQTVVQKKLHSQ